MKLDLSTGIDFGGCSKPNCLLSRIHRHHMGCEGMWLRHFKKRKRSKKYQDYEERYFKFLPLDTVRLCEGHHQEIHDLYYPIICEHIRKNGVLNSKRKEQAWAVKDWTWEQAYNLINHLRGVCNKWLLVESPAPAFVPRKKPKRPKRVSQ